MRLSVLQLGLIAAKLLGEAPAACGKERKSTPVILLETDIPIKPKDFMQHWHDQSFYRDYLQKTGDIDIEIGDWKAQDRKTKERKVVSKHRVSVSLPSVGIPKHVKSSRVQRLSDSKARESSNEQLVVLEETNNVEGFPFSDRFFVTMKWEARWPKGIAGPMRLTVTQQLVFRKPFWLEKKVEGNSAKETQQTLQVWIALTNKKLGLSEKTEALKSTHPGKDAPSASFRRMPWTEIMRVNGSSILLVTALFSGAHYLQRHHKRRPEDPESQ